MIQIEKIKVFEAEIDTSMKRKKIFKICSKLENGKKPYLVNKRNGTCQCGDHENRGKYGIVCKHRIADKLARQELENMQDDHKETLVTFASMED